MAEYDTEVRTIGNKWGRQSNTTQAINAAQRQGKSIETTKKYAASQNKQSSAAKNTAKLDRETEELHHEHVALSLSRLIQKSRQDKEMTQKELATKINEKPQVINEYESGKAIPNQQVISKLERCLGVKLRGKDMGLPFVLGKK
ncbi:endothelial differentiation-related factor 1-like [Mizuhopecten yessoensis]|uniref:Endothelial differentiation-related factor 1 n=1 Tax=Mizuhopecten yessoensis TaxID=6573 RepID=A0A210QRY3_MIZYE|nr:endothelial differentiation-related factor 1-like [Mizuhopecten yessoensis]OWF51494.1 Endothelial differentiation-related factor 1 [Mizuhopecten yessoensis]